MDRFEKLISTKTGLKQFIITEFISDTQVNDGTIISFFLLSLFKIFKAAIVIKFAEEPEFTKTECLTPSHLDHLFSNSLTLFDCVNTIFFLLN